MSGFVLLAAEYYDAVFEPRAIEKNTLLVQRPINNSLG